MGGISLGGILVIIGIVVDPLEPLARDRHRPDRAHRVRWFCAREVVLSAIWAGREALEAFTSGSGRHARDHPEPLRAFDRPIGSELNETGKAKVKAEVTYTSDADIGGDNPNTESKKIKLIKR